MNANDSKRVLSLYERALDLQGAARDAFLERECGSDPNMKDMLASMLSTEIDPGFLDPAELPFSGKPGSQTGAIGASGLPSPAGRRIGPFQLQRVLGSGGMGVVYEALQDYPKRRVALKMLRTDFLLGSSERRFRSEVELLARLEHPGVARIFEAGLHLAEDGSQQPYFAMEFVDGARDFVTWASGRPLQQRVQGFVEVCDAVHHGHQRGVVHRDLKPHNVLVDCEGHSKVIDFGVARALESGSPTGPRATRVGELVGTLSHMAPEQFGMDGQEVDTRTDVYALGVLLFELLYERLPYDLADKPMTEVVRIIREVAPIPLKRLDGNVPQELGWIALKALQKDPRQRYASVSELAGDLRRFLTHRPVEAGPPSRLLRARKFVRRNRLMVSAALLVVLISATGGAISFGAMLRARTENEKFRGINSVLTDMFVAVRADEEGPSVRAADLLDRAALGLSRSASHPEVEAALRRTLAKSFFNLGMAEKAAEQAQRALDLRAHLSSSELGDTAYHLGHSLLLLDRDQEARAIVEAHLPQTTGLPPELGPATYLALRLLDAKLLDRAGHPAESLVRMRRIVKDSQGWLGEDASATLHFQLTLIDLLLKAGQLTDAELVARELLSKRERIDGAKAAETLVARSKWARIRSRIGELEGAIALQEELVRDEVDVFGESHPFTLAAMGDLANSYILNGDQVRAVPILEEVVRIREQRDGAEHSGTLTAKSSLAVALASLGDERALDIRKEGYEVRRKTLGPDHPEALKAQLALSRYLRQAGEGEQAKVLLLDLHARSVRVLVDDDLVLHEATAELGMALIGLGETQAGAELLERAWRGYQRRAAPQDSTTLTLGSNYGYALMRLGHWEQAVPVLSEVLLEMREKLAASDPTQLATLSNLAIASARSGESLQAEVRFREALAWSEAWLEIRDARRIRMQMNLAEHLVESERPEQALEVYEGALAAADLNPAWLAEDQAILRLGYARCLRGCKRFREAADEMEFVLELERKRLGPGAPAIEALLQEQATIVRESE